MAKPTLLDRKACRNAPCMFGHPHMFGFPAYVWMSPYIWTPHMFGCPLCVLMMFGCPLYMHNTKKACFVRQRGCPDAPITFGYPTYVWMPHVCLDAPCMFRYPHMFGCPPICLDDVWMSPCTYTTQRKHNLSDWWGAICTPYIWMPLYV